MILIDKMATDHFVGHVLHSAVKYGRVAGQNADVVGRRRIKRWARGVHR